MKITNLISLLIILLPIFMNGQNEISFEKLDQSIIPSPINKIYDSFKIGKETILLCDTRNKGDLNMLVVVFSESGDLIEHKIIGEKDALERPVTLIKNGPKNKLLLSNVLTDGKTKLMLFTLDEGYKILNKKEIPIENLSQGTGMILNGQMAMITASVFRENDMYPIVISYNLTTSEIEKQVNLDQRHSSAEGKVKEYTTFEQDKSGNEIYTGTKKLIFKHAMYKVSNQIKFSSTSKDEIIILGYESNEEITDFWVCKISKGLVAWEKVYTSKLGGDEGLDLFILDNGNYLLSGIGYTKSTEVNYQVRGVLIDPSGNVIKDQMAKNKTRTFYKNAIALPNNKYVFLGQSELIEYTGAMFEEKVLVTDFSLFVFDENLEKKQETNFELEKGTEIMKVTAFSDQLVGVFYKVDKKMSMMKVKILGNTIHHLDQKKAAKE